MPCKLGYVINCEKDRLDRPCHVCGEKDCEESICFEGYEDDGNDEFLFQEE